LASRWASVSRLADTLDQVERGQDQVFLCLVGNAEPACLAKMANYQRQQSRLGMVRDDLVHGGL
jgi:hypothetical protein